MSDSRPYIQSWWKTFLDFLWDGGYRSTIVFAVVLGAINITVFSNEICKPMPASLDNPKNQPVPAQPNPICAKYFELALMVVGGYLGLSTAKTNRTPVSGLKPTGDDAAITPQTPSPDQPGTSSPAPGAVQNGPSTEQAVSDGADTRLHADNPDNQEPGPQQVNQQLSGFSRGGGGA